MSLLVRSHLLCNVSSLLTLALHDSDAFSGPCPSLMFLLLPLVCTDVLDQVYFSCPSSKLNSLTGMSAYEWLSSFPDL